MGIFTYALPGTLLVIPVNTVGVMGAGLARQCKERYPGVYRWYLLDCQDKFLPVGTTQVYPASVEGGAVWIATLPTKDHWKKPSSLGYVRSGLRSLRGWLHAADMTASSYEVNTVVVPPLGCGLGGLYYEDVRPIILEEMVGINQKLILTGG